VESAATREAGYREALNQQHPVVVIADHRGGRQRPTGPEVTGPHLGQPRGPRFVVAHATNLEDNPLHRPPYPVRALSEGAQTDLISPLCQVTGFTLALVGHRIP